jgi:hypothetical protein
LPAFEKKPAVAGQQIEIVDVASMPGALMLPGIVLFSAL